MRFEEIDTKPIERYLRAVVTQSATDLLLTEGSAPRLRIDGRLVPIAGEPVLTDEQVRWLIGHLAYEEGIGRELWDKVRTLKVDPPRGQLTLKESVLVEGEGADASGRDVRQRWEDYTQTAVDPVDDCTIWYVGDYVKKGATTYSSKIGAFRLPGCRAQ